MIKYLIIFGNWEIIPNYLTGEVVSTLFIWIIKFQFKVITDFVYAIWSWILQDLVRNRDHKKNFLMKNFCTGSCKISTRYEPSKKNSSMIILYKGSRYLSIPSKSIHFKATAIDGIPKLEITNNRKFRLHFKSIKKSVEAKGYTFLTVAKKNFDRSLIPLKVN